jgi:hypothetical protein
MFSLFENICFLFITAKLFYVKKLISNYMPLLNHKTVNNKPNDEKNIGEKNGKGK